MTRLPIAVAYFFFLGFWLFLCHLSDAPSLHAIHRLMSCGLLVKALSSLTSPLDPRDDPRTQLIRISLLLAVTLLLVEITRTSILPLRQNRPKKAVTTVIAARIVVNAVVGKMAGTNSVIMAFVTVNLLAGFSVLVCLVWLVAQLGEELKCVKKLEARRAVDKVMIFLQSYMGVLALSFAMKLLSAALRSVNSVAEEIASLICYAVMFYWFRTEYFIAVDEEDTEPFLP